MALAAKRPPSHMLAFALMALALIAVPKDSGQSQADVVTVVN